MKNTLIYSVLIFGMLLLISTFFKGKIIHEQFNSEKWKNMTSSESNWSLRWDMMNSLRSDYDLIGMTENQIIELLGNPENKTETEFNYYLGYSKRGVNTGYLVILFDKEGKVMRFFVYDS